MVEPQPTEPNNNSGAEASQQIERSGGASARPAHISASSHSVGAFPFMLWFVLIVILFGIAFLAYRQLALEKVIRQDFGLLFGLRFEGVQLKVGSGYLSPDDVLVHSAIEKNPKEIKQEVEKTHKLSLGYIGKDKLRDATIVLCIQYHDERSVRHLFRSELGIDETRAQELQRIGGSDELKRYGCLTHLIELPNLENAGTLTIMFTATREDKPVFFLVHYTRNELKKLIGRTAP